MNYRESLSQTLNESYISTIMKKYDKRFKIVSEAFTGFTDDQALKLGILLENTEDAFNRCRVIREATQAGGVGAELKHQYFDILTAFFPGLIAEELFSVQPLKNKVGEVFFLKYILASKKGAVGPNTVAFSHNTIEGYNNYTGEEVDQDLIFTGDGTTTTYEGTIAWVPVKPGTLSIVLEDVGTITDNKNGGFTGTGLGSGSTIDYKTGAFKIVLSTAFGSGKTAIASYSYDLGVATSASQIPEMDLKVESELIVASPHKLRGTYSLDAGYDLQMSQGININDALLEAASAQLRHETDGNLIMGAYNNATQTISFNRYYPAAGGSAHLSKREFYEEFVDTITRASSMVWSATRRVRANWIVCGKDAADILTFLGEPRFKKANTSDAVGPHFAGTLDGTWKVYFNPFMADDQFLVGYKGNTLIDAGLIYAPYLPFFATETVMLDDFIGRRGFATTYGKKNINNKLYVKGTITNTAP